jgi:cytoskeletal protein CcmA (bactofilin family)
MASANGRDSRQAPPITVIADGTKVDGSVSVGGDLRVDGAVEGAMLSADACEIAPHGVVSVETARAHVLVVHGRLRATEVYATRVSVMPTGQLYAHVVVAESVDVDAGGKLAAQLEVARGGSAP